MATLTPDAHAASETSPRKARATLSSHPGARFVVQGIEGRAESAPLRLLKRWPEIRGAVLSCSGYLLVILAALILSSMPARCQQDDSFHRQAHQTQLSDSLTRQFERPEPASQQPSSSAIVCGPAHLGQCLKDLARDQAGIWTSPLHIHSKDLLWLIPFGGATAAALHYDASAQEALGIDHTRINTSNRMSLFGSPLATFGEGSGLYLAGWLSHNDHLAETGRLGAEAVIDASLVTEAIKLATNRERPDQGNGRGGFWPHGTRQYSLNGSFPSGHAGASWALARVIASEYPSKWVQVGVYAFATAISVTRVTARKHFPSDVLVGGTFGYLVGGTVIHQHAQQTAAGISVTPLMDESTRTFGVRVQFRPEEMDLTKVGSFVRRLHRFR